MPLPPPSILSPETNRGSADYDRRHVIGAAASYVLPLDLQLAVSVTVHSGAAIDITNNRALDGPGEYRLRVDAVPGVPQWIDGALNPQAFALPTDARQGTLGRNSFSAPVLRQFDLSVSRTLRIGDRFSVETRADAFNVFNVVNVGAPESRFERPQFGQPVQLAADALGTGSLTRGGLSPLQQLGGPRAIQISARFRW